MVKNLAVIPARSGSKRVPNKNIIDFMGKPIMAYTIEAALQSGVYDDVIVSTDSEQYAEIAVKYGAQVPFLRGECADDYSTVGDVINYTLRELSSRFGKEYDSVCSLQVSCPLRDCETIKAAYKYFTEKDTDRLLTCFAFNFMNPWWAFKMRDESAEFILSCPSQSRSQDNEQLYCPTGAIAFSKIKKKGTKSVYYPIDWKKAVDIDSYDDIEFAKAVYLMTKNDL